MVRELCEDVAPSSASRGVKARRASRVTSAQVDALLSFLEASPYLHNRSSASPRGRKKIDKWWKEVAEELNRLPNGSIKTAEQWMTVWRDFKSRTVNKLVRLRKERVQTGNRASTTAPLTEVERRIVSVLQNSSYISKPALLVQTFAPIVQKPAPVVQKPAPIVQKPEPIVQKPAPIVQRQISTPNRNLDSSSSVDEQDSSAQQDFLPVAESNAESIRIFADAAKLQAEAAKIQVDTSIMFANAADKIAEAARIQAETSLIIAKTADKIAEALIKLSEKLNNN